MLSEKRIYLLNALTYSEKSDVPTDGVTSVQDYVQYLQKKANNANDAELYRQILQDKTLCGMEIQLAAYDGANGRSSAAHEAIYGDATVMVFTNRQPDGSTEAVVSFEGSKSAADWRDDFQGGGPTDTADGVSTRIQESALDFYESPEVQAILQGCDTITVTGHSKGGNNANYVAIMDDRVTRSVTFDAQGYSDQFFEKYGDRIAQRQGVIDNYSCDRDYVNILLNKTGEQHYYETPDVSFFGAHSYDNFLNCSFSSGEEVPQDPGMQALDDMLNIYLRSAEQGMAEGVYTAFADIAYAVMGGDTDESALALIFRGDNAKALGDFLGYAASYMLNNPSRKEAILDTIVEAHPVVGRIVEFAVMKPVLFAGLASGIAALANKLSGGLLMEAVKKLLKKAGLDLSMESGSLIGLIQMIAAIASGFVSWNQAFANGIVTSGTDIAVHTAAPAQSVLRWDVHELTVVASRLKELSTRLAAAANETRQTASQCDDCQFSMSVRIKQSFLSSTDVSCSGTPELVLEKIAQCIKTCSVNTEALSGRLTSVVEMFESTEKKIADGFNSLTSV